MKFKCTQSDLSTALKVVGRAIPSRSPMPILSGLKISAVNGSVTITASDLSMTIEKQMDAEIESTGETVVPGNLLTRIVNKLPRENPITMESDGCSLKIDTQGSHFHLTCMPIDEYPLIEENNSTMSVTLNKDTFIDMIKGTAFATSDDETKLNLTGIFVEIANQGMTFVALDGFRMAVRHEPVVTQDRFKFLVPSNTMKEISRINNDSDTITVQLGDNVSMFASGDTKIYTRLLDHKKYVDWKKIIPKEFSTVAYVNTDELVESVNRASLFTEGKNNLVKVHVMEDNLEITSNSELGSVKENVVADTDGDDMLIGYNSKYLLDALKAIDDEDVSFSFISPQSPSVIKPIEGRTFLYLVLPVRI